MGTPHSGSTAEPSSEWLGEEERELVVLSIPNTSLSGAARVAWSCLREPPRGWTREPSIQGRIRFVSEGTGCSPRGWRLLHSYGKPFRWDEDRRFRIRAELDAAFFHLYLPADANGEWIPARKADGCPYDETPEQLAELKKSFPKPREAVSYIMDTFPIVKRKDEAAYGSYRTKEMILRIYDEMQAAVRTGGGVSDQARSGAWEQGLLSSGEDGDEALNMRGIGDLRQALSIAGSTPRGDRSVDRVDCLHG